MPNTLKYRPDIDGLRARAVVPVVLFHAGFNWIPGGYVGVDVFFVISGYLITMILLAELSDGSFSIANFYERRIRRLLPALLFVLLVTTYFAWLWLPASEFHDYGQSLMATAGFYSNFFFWKTSNYFSTASELMPLLHMWSLAVEEQYYIFYPLLLLFLWRIRANLYLFLGGTLLLSFLLASWSISSNPESTFYLLPTRAWELLVGAIAAMLHFQKRASLANDAIANCGGITGIFLILYACITFEVDASVPGPAALVPVSGAFFVITFCREGSFEFQATRSSRSCVLQCVSLASALVSPGSLAFIR